MAQHFQEQPTPRAIVWVQPALDGPWLPGRVDDAPPPSGTHVRVRFFQEHAGRRSCVVPWCAHTPAEALPPSGSEVMLLAAGAAGPRPPQVELWEHRLAERAADPAHSATVAKVESARRRKQQLEQQPPAPAAPATAVPEDDPGLLLQAAVQAQAQNPRPRAREAPVALAVPLLSPVSQRTLASLAPAPQAVPTAPPAPSSAEAQPPQAQSVPAAGSLGSLPTGPMSGSLLLVAASRVAAEAEGTPQPAPRPSARSVESVDSPVVVLHAPTTAAPQAPPAAQAAPLVPGRPLSGIPISVDLSDTDSDDDVPLLARAHQLMGGRSAAKPKAPPKMKAPPARPDAAPAPRTSVTVVDSQESQDEVQLLPAAPPRVPAPPAATPTLLVNAAEPTAPQNVPSAPAKAPAKVAPKMKKPAPKMGAVAAALMAVPAASVAPQEAVEPAAPAVPVLPPSAPPAPPVQASVPVVHPVPSEVGPEGPPPRSATSSAMSTAASVPQMLHSDGLMEGGVYGAAMCVSAFLTAPTALSPQRGGGGPSAVELGLRDCVAALEGFGLPYAVWGSAVWDSLKGTPAPTAQSPLAALGALLHDASQAPPSTVASAPASLASQVAAAVDQGQHGPPLGLPLLLLAFHPLPAVHCAAALWLAASSRPASPVPAGAPAATTADITALCALALFFAAAVLEPLPTAVSWGSEEHPAGLPPSTLQQLRSAVRQCPRPHLAAVGQLLGVRLLTLLDRGVSLDTVGRVAGGAAVFSSEAHLFLAAIAAVLTVVAGTAAEPADARAFGQRVATHIRGTKLAQDVARCHVLEAVAVTSHSLAAMNLVCACSEEVVAATAQPSSDGPAPGEPQLLIAAGAGAQQQKRKDGAQRAQALLQATEYLPVGVAVRIVQLALSSWPKTLDALPPPATTVLVEPCTAVAISVLRQRATVRDNGPQAQQSTILALLHVVGALPWGVLAHHDALFAVGAGTDLALDREQGSAGLAPSDDVVLGVADGVPAARDGLRSWLAGGDAKEARPTFAEPLHRVAASPNAGPRLRSLATAVSAATLAVDLPLPTGHLNPNAPSPAALPTSVAVASWELAVRFVPKQHPLVALLLVDHLTALPFELKSFSPKVANAAAALGLSGAEPLSHSEEREVELVRRTLGFYTVATSRRAPPSAGRTSAALGNVAAATAAAAHGGASNTIATLQCKAASFAPDPALRRLSIALDPLSPPHLAVGSEASLWALRRTMRLTLPLSPGPPIKDGWLLRQCSQVLWPSLVHAGASALASAHSSPILVDSPRPEVTATLAEDFVWPLVAFAVRSLRDAVPPHFRSALVKAAVETLQDTPPSPLLYEEILGCTRLAPEVRVRAAFAFGSAVPAELLDPSGTGFDPSTADRIRGLLRRITPVTLLTEAAADAAQYPGRFPAWLLDLASGTGPLSQAKAASTAHRQDAQFAQFEALERRLEQEAADRKATDAKEVAARYAAERAALAAPAALDTAALASIAERKRQRSAERATEADDNRRRALADLRSGVVPVARSAPLDPVDDRYAALQAQAGAALEKAAAEKRKAALERQDHVFAVDQARLRVEGAVKAVQDQAIDVALRTNIHRHQMLLALRHARSRKPGPWRRELVAVDAEDTRPPEDSLDGIAEGPLPAIPARFNPDAPELYVSGMALPVLAELRHGVTREFDEVRASNDDWLPANVVSCNVEGGRERCCIVAHLDADAMARRTASPAPVPSGQSGSSRPSKRGRGRSDGFVSDGDIVAVLIGDGSNAAPGWDHTGPLRAPDTYDTYVAEGGKGAKEYYAGLPGLLCVGWVRRFDQGSAQLTMAVRNWNHRAMDTRGRRVPLLVTRLAAGAAVLHTLKALGDAAKSPLWELLHGHSPVPPMAVPQKESPVARYNVPQANAIRGACKDENNMPLQRGVHRPLMLRLIQGPPGTGKTHTIVGIVTTLLVKDVAAGRQPHILVCAGSNAAVDNVLARLKDVCINAGEKRKAKLVRVGVKSSVDPAVRPLHCDDQPEGRSKAIAMADVVCTTLGSLRSVADECFTDVILDEAAQATEPDVVAALTVKGCRRCVMVGDVAQLQATVLSPAAGRSGLKRSLMERLVANGAQPAVLTEQHRMAPDIVAWPNKRFYGGRLTTAEARLRNTQLTFTPHGGGRPLPGLTFIDIEGIEGPHRQSLHNRPEAELVAELVRLLCPVIARRRMGDEAPRQDHDIPHTRLQDAAMSIGVITFYEAQRREIDQRLSRRYNNAVKVATVDSFQGQERTAIIVSCVRAQRRSGEKGRNPFRGIGFVSDDHRCNVALTRARGLLFVVGDSTALGSDDMWGSLVQHCRDTGCITTAKSIRDLGLPTAKA